MNPNWSMAVPAEVGALGALVVPFFGAKRQKEQLTLPFIQNFDRKWQLTLPFIQNFWPK